MENKKKLINQINELRTMLRNHYKLIADDLYLITLATDEYLEWLSNGLKGDELEVPKPE